MANKSGDNSLRDWFGKSKSSDGTPGWVQLGGKYAGKPCARQPGQKTKPKCGSSKMKRNLNKKEEQKAFRRKNAKDPNPNRKGKAINVATEETTTSLFRRLLDEKKKCWKGYKKVGTQKLFGKTYNRCVKAEDFEYDSAADNSEFPARKSFLSLAHGYASEENYQMLLKDMALYCQSRKVWIDWYDEFHDNLRRMIEKREDLLLAIEQLLYYHVNERGGTRDDDTLVLKLYVTGPDYDIDSAP